MSQLVSTHGKPVRIAQVMGKMHGGGVEAMVMNYYRHIDRDLIQFDFFVDSDSTLVPTDEIEALGGEVIKVPPYQKTMQYMATLEKNFQNRKYRIVHSHINALSVFPLRAAKRAGVPIRIAHSHNTSGSGEPLKSVAKNALKKFANVYPTNRFACSRVAGEWLFGGDASFEVIYNAIDLDSFKFDLPSREAVRSDLQISDNQFVIGHVGRFMPQKNHAFLIEAFARLCEQRDDCLLVCIGTGELRPAAERLASQCGVAEKVLFLGQRDNVNRYYQAFDAFVLPSLYEGLGIVAVEAQRAGLPCLLSDNVPREVRLTDMVEFLPIGEADMWANALSALHVRGDRNAKEEVFLAYDIVQAARSLQMRYFELLGKLDFDRIRSNEGFKPAVRMM